MAQRTILNTVERKFILLLGDLLIIVASLNVFINYAIDREFTSFRLQATIYAVGLLTYLGLAYSLDFYNIQNTTKRRFIITQSLYITFLFVFFIFLFSVLYFDASFWRIPLISFLVLTPLQIALWRLLFRNLFQLIPITKNVFYIYDEVSTETFKDDIDKINGEGLKTFYKVKLTYSVNQQVSLDKKIFRDATDKIDTWIINTKSYDLLPEPLERILLKSMIKGKEIISFTSFYENTYEALPIRSHNDSFQEILKFRNNKIRYLQRIFSFGVNFVLSTLVGLVFVISIPFVVLGNLFFNRGPLFYVQKRVGQYGKEFKIYKFRSMIVDAEEAGAKMATKDDSRITPFGKILRVFRIDELPQIISVIKGDMQFIGPRPERKVFVDQLKKILPFYNARHLIKPGITGWAQVKYKYGENLEDSIRKLEYDLYYIKNRSITLDLRIIFKTITTILFSRGV
ncbi:sugar transferase [Robiginitalea sp. IMCC43444]|uniref:sugar transferase n=1 Tax=Robiginitalea sp. IMCC43444 TaxID=3459121 RepID=UPI004042154C